jgi:hypothetical protein
MIMDAKSQSVTATKLKSSGCFIVISGVANWGRPTSGNQAAPPPKRKSNRIHEARTGLAYSSLDRSNYHRTSHAVYARGTWYRSGSGSGRRTHARRLADQKNTPSGSKKFVPPAHVTGPLKSPAPWDLAHSAAGKYELVHNWRFFPDPATGIDPRPLLVRGGLAPSAQGGSSSPLSADAGSLAR